MVSFCVILGHEIRNPTEICLPSTWTFARAWPASCDMRLEFFCEGIDIWTTLDSTAESAKNWGLLNTACQTCGRDLFDLKPSRLLYSSEFSSRFGMGVTTERLWPEHYGHSIFYTLVQEEGSLHKVKSTIIQTKRSDRSLTNHEPRVWGTARLGDLLNPARIFFSSQLATGNDAIPLQRQQTHLLLSKLQKKFF